MRTKDVGSSFLKAGVLVVFITYSAGGIRTMKILGTVDISPGCNMERALTAVNC
jgi:hypothetical protein